MVNYCSHIYHQLLAIAKLKGQCILCGNNGQAGFDLCTACEQALPTYSRNHLNNQPLSCYRCALPLLSIDPQLCGHCIRQPPPFTRTISSWVYQPPIAQLITSYKYRSKLSYGRTLAMASLKSIVSAYQHEPFPQVIIPTPLHWQRRIQRGFNQSERLAQYYSKQLHIPMQRALTRCRNTAAQKLLTAKQRQQNLRNAFKVSQPIKELRVALVDDVMTTTSTACEMSRCLLKAGAKEVHIWCLARTPE